MKNEKRNFEVLNFNINADIVSVEFKTDDGTFEKSFLIIDEQEKVSQLLKLQSLEFIFSTLKKLINVGLVSDRLSLEAELGI